MGVLTGLLRRLEREAADRPYECLNCGTFLDLEYYTCPHCGSYSIDRRSVPQ